MSTTDDLLRNAEEYAASFDKGELPLPPAKGFPNCCVRYSMTFRYPPTPTSSITPWPLSIASWKKTAFHSPTKSSP